MREREETASRAQTIPIFPGGFALERAVQRGESFTSLDNMVSRFWGRTKNLLISLDYHDALTTLHAKTIPAPQLAALNTQVSRLRFILGNRVDVVVNTIGPFKNVETDTGLPVIANSGIDLQESPGSPIITLQPERVKEFKAIRDKATARLAGQDGPKLVSRNDRASFIPIGDQEIDPEKARAMLYEVIPPDEAKLLRVFVNTDAGKISLSPGSFKQDGAAEFIKRNGKDPAETTYIHVGEDSSNIPLEGSSFGQTYFVTPYNAPTEVKEYASFQSAATSPDAAPNLLGEIADSVGRRALAQTTQALQEVEKEEAHAEAVTDVKRWIETSARTIAESFHTIPTPRLIFDNLQTIFGTPISDAQREILLCAVINTSVNQEAQLAYLAGIKTQEYARRLDINAFADHPLVKADNNYPGMTFLATRGAVVREPVLIDSMTVPAEYEEAMLETSAGLTHRLAGKLEEALGDDMRNTVFLSIYRGGIYPAIGLQQIIKTKSGLEIPHYSVIPHKLNDPTTIEVQGTAKKIQYTLAGEDLAHVIEQHPGAKLVFVDGWVGSGQTILNIRDVLTQKKDHGELNNDFYFASLLDSLGITDFTATTDDQIMGWNMWPFNDYTYGFYHKNNQPGNQGLLTVTPDTNSFSITQERLTQWLHHINTTRTSWDEQPTVSLSPKEILAGTRAVIGIAEEDFDIARIKLGINESLIRVRNDNGGFWKFLAIRSETLQSPEIQKLLEVARHRGVRIFHTADLPYIAVLSQDSFTNPELTENEIAMQTEKNGLASEATLFEYPSAIQ